MPGRAFPTRALRAALGVAGVIVAGSVALSPGQAERIPSGPIPDGPIRGEPERAPPDRAAVPDAPPPAMPKAASDPARRKPSPRELPMQVRVVRDGRPGCGSTCAEWIAAEGSIVPGTHQGFERVFREIGTRRLPVFIDSGGGAVEDAMAIGRMIRERRLDVVVTQTVQGCADCGPNGARAKGYGAVCASACVLVLAAGTERLAAPWTLVGVHQMIVRGTRTVVQRRFRVFYRVRHGVRREIGRELISQRPVSTMPFTAPASEATDEKVERYLVSMGIDAAIMPMMLSTPPESIHRMTRAEQGATHLVTTFWDGEALVAGAERKAKAAARAARSPNPQATASPPAN